MRAMRTSRLPTAAKLAVGATVLAFPATAMAVTSSGSAGTAAAGSLHAVHPSAARYGHRTFLRGHAPASAAGTAVALEYRPATSTHWRTIGHGRVLPNGHFVLPARVSRSGSLQVVALQAAPSAPAPQSAVGSSPATDQFAAAQTVTTAAAHAKLQASPVEHVTVKPELSLARRSAEAVVGRPEEIRGHLLPGVAGRRLVLDVRRNGRWVAAAHARTRRSGAFRFSYAPTAAGAQHVRVAFAGDRLNGRAKSASESVSPMEYAEVSWYEDAGNTACGFHATYGIASRTLPCGSKVTLSYGGHSVVATVDDRGPFVYSRLYDLNQTVAGKLGMYGVATVLASV